MQIWHHNENKIQTAPSNGAIWDEFNGQQQHQSIRKTPYLMPNQHFLADKVQI